MAECRNHALVEQAHLTVQLTIVIQERLQASSADLYSEWQALTDRYLLTQILYSTGGNFSQAAKILGIHRVTLRTKIAALAIKVDRTSPLERSRARTLSYGFSGSLSSP